MLTGIIARLSSIIPALGNQFINPRVGQLASSHARFYSDKKTSEAAKRSISNFDS